MAENSEFLLLLPASSLQQVEKLLPVALPIAKKRRARVILLHVQIWPDGRNDLAGKGADAWLKTLARKFEEEGVAAETMIRPGHSMVGVVREVAEQLQPDLLMLSWRRTPHDVLDARDLEMHELLLDVPCDSVVWRGSYDIPEPRRILLPSAGGPNAELAMSFAEDLAASYHGSITWLSVLPVQADDAKVEQTRAHLQKSLSEKLGPRAAHMHIQVIRARSPAQGILQAARPEHFDLLMIGASREHIVARMLFGQIPDRVAREAQIPVLVTKRPPPRRVTVGRRVLDAFVNHTPTLTEAEKVDAYRELRRSARANTDFLTMMGLSTLIAGLGLLLDSPAVVIGAMLVAPLMSAVVALGLGVVQGDARLLKTSVTSLAKGIALGLILSVLLGSMVRFEGVTDEMQARGSPGLLDLGVAVFAGAAAAYALCRRQLSSALPGVAIAVALVPPLATVGLALAQAEIGLAAGASLLFLTNLVAIAAVGGVVFLLLGFQPDPRRRDRIRWFSRGWRGLSLLMVLIVVILSAVTARSIADARLQTQIETAIVQAVNELPHARLREYEYDASLQDRIIIQVRIETPETIDETRAEAMQGDLAQMLNRPVELILDINPTIRLEPKPP
ncbi:MAG: DUF389 domain-containing protein [Chloroflexi bacterium]|nr:DUF389 domain-containing protein [Chloroflexota bacterium]